MIQNDWQKISTTLLSILGVVSLAITTYIEFAPYYGRLSLPIFGIVFGFIGLCLLRPSLATILLFASAPFFGNHPGGRFLEFFILLCFFYVTVSILIHRVKVSLRFFGLYVVWISVLLLPLLMQPILYEASLYFKNGLYYLFSANEHSPLYSLQQIVWLAVIPMVGVVSVQYRQSILWGVTLAFLITVTVGSIEIFSPEFAALLDKVHIYIDGYADHFPIYKISSFVPSLPQFGFLNSLFWNRSWHAVFLVATLPFVFLLIQDNHKHFQWRTRIAYYIGFFAFLTLYFLAIGARGALIAWSVFVISFITSNIMLHTVPKSKLFQYLPIMMTGSALLLQILIPILTIATEVGQSEYRYAQTAAAIKVSNLFPFAGGGTESYGYYNNYYLRPLGESAKHGTSHSQLLQIMTGNGLWGVFFYAVLILTFGLQLSRKLSNLVQEPAAPKRNSLIQQILIVSIGMTSCLIYGSFQEWNYIRPVSLFWVILLLWPFFDTRPNLTLISPQAQSKPANLSLFAPYALIIVLIVIFSFRIDDRTDSMPRSQSPAAFEPAALSIGVEYVAPDSLIILKGRSHILLPNQLDIDDIKNLQPDTDIVYEWLPSTFSDKRFLKINCLTNAKPVKGDTDARRLCAKLSIPQLSSYFQSVEKPDLYRQREQKNRKSSAF